MKNTLETRLGIFFALALIAAFIILEMLGGAKFLKRGTHVYGLFHNVQELKVGDPVKLAGVQIGQVEKIGLTNDQVKVTMKINKDADVKADSKAMIKFTGLMGQNFVSLDFGTPNGVKAVDGVYLPTGEQPDLSAIMVKLDNVATGVENLTKSFSGDQIGNLLGPFTDFLKENSPRLTAMIGNMQTISSQIAEGKGTVGKLINDDALYVSALNTVSNLQSTSTEIKLTLERARTVVDGAKTTIDDINAGQGTLGKLAKDEKLYNETTAAMTNLREIMEKINRGQGSVGKLVNDESLLKNVKLSLQKLDKATEGLEDTGPLSVLGTAVNSLF
jgi:phospholipid/cholesterol/gamma-HCH transport system substrate-binding protein